MHIKRKCVIILIIALVVQQFACCCTAKADVVNSYYLLKYEYKDFVNPLLYAGASENQIIEFLRDVEDTLKTAKNLNRDNIEGYFKQAIFSAVSQEDNITVTNAVLDVYGDSIDEYTETGRIPEKLRSVYDAVVEAVLGERFENKKELVAAYEKYKAKYDAGLSGYTAESVSKLKTALDDAAEVLGNISATNDDVSKTLESLNSAYEGLTRIVEQQSNGNGSSAGSGGNAGGSAPVVVDKTPFSDLKEEHWSYNAVKELTSKGVISGFEDKTFRPDKFVTREEFAKIVCAAFDLQPSEEQIYYKDAVQGAWYNQYIQTITSNHIMVGVGDAQFGVGNTLSRQDLAVIVYRMITNSAINREFDEKMDVQPFADLESASDYAIEAIASIQKKGIISGVGDGMFAPTKGVTRAEAAQIIYNIIK